MKNLQELREGLAEVFEGLKAGTIERHIATEMINAAGKMINSAKLELEYKSIQLKSPSLENIPFITGKKS